MLSPNLKQVVFVVRKVRCRCVITVAPIRPDVFETLSEYVYDPDYEIDLGATHANRDLGCEHEEQP